MNETVIEELKAHLLPYLSSKGIKVIGKFQCFTGLHNDSTPSVGIVPGTDNMVWHCLGCSTSGTIFHAAHYLEDMPIEGPDFWKVTVSELAKRFKIEYTEETLTQEDKERYQLLAIHRDVAAYVASSLDRQDSMIHCYLLDRKWTVETARALGIGTVDNFDIYLKTMKALGWTQEFMQQVGLLDRRIFSHNSLIFTVNDINGRPVAFAARNMLVKQKGDEEKYGAKYVNSPLSVIYPKGRILYGLNECLDLPGPLWIVEGYPDRVTLWQAGTKKVAAIGGTSFTSPSEAHKTGENHLDVLIEHNLTNLILCLDGDTMGVHNTGKIIDEHLVKAPTVSARICNLPPTSDDPDSFISENGLEEFNKFQLLAPFAWKLDHLPYNADPKETADKMIPLIVNEPNSISRWDMCRTLSAKTNIPLDFINQEVLNQTNGIQNMVQKKILQAGKDMQRKLSSLNDTDSIVTMVGDYYGKMLNMIEDTTNEQVDYVEKVASVKNLLLNKNVGNRFSCGKLTQISEALGGFPCDAQMMILTGYANIGKTSFVRNLAWELIRSNPEIHLIFMSIDDSFQKIINGFVSLLTGVPQDLVSNRILLEKNPVMEKTVLAGFDEMAKLKDRMVIKDDDDGFTVLAMEKHINEAIKKYPEKKLVFMLDNFHRLADVDSGKWEEMDSTAKRIKRMCKRYNIPMFVNVELRKTEWSSRATIRDVKGTGSIEFVSDLVWILHQNYHIDRQSVMIWNNKGTTSPINELECPKNKITGSKGNIFFKFDPKRSRYEEMNPTEAQTLVSKEVDRIRAKGATYDASKKYNGSGRGNTYGKDSGSSDATPQGPSQSVS